MGQGGEMTGSGERMPEVAVEGVERVNPDVELIRAKMAQFGLAASDEIVLSYTLTDNQGKLIIFPALVPLDQIDLCPVPLREMPDEALKLFLATSQAELSKLPEGSQQRDLARRIGAKLIQNIIVRKQQS